MAVQNDRYQLLHRIAAGGMGEVYLAVDRVGPPAGQRVALKLLLPHLSDEASFVSMFLDEARISARLNHRNIPRVLDVGMADGRYYLAIELIEGVSASQLLKACARAGGMLPLPVVRRIAQGLCEALEYAHSLADEQGRPLEIVHRDVSPSNVLLSTSGRVLLNDFGIARARGKSHATRTGEVKGKFAYMPPEQLDASAPVDQRADVYSAALTLYQLLTLELPFLRDTEAQIIDAVRAGAIADVTAARADVTPGLASAIRSGTAKRPADRPQSARALLEALLDGPVASGEDLAATVESLCAQELAVFRRPVSAERGSGPRTAALRPGPSAVRAEEGLGSAEPGLATSAALAQLRPPWWRWFAALVFAGAVAGGVGGAWHFSGKEARPPPAAGGVPQAVGELGARREAPGSAPASPGGAVAAGPQGGGPAAGQQGGGPAAGQPGAAPAPAPSADPAPARQPAPQPGRSRPAKKPAPMASAPSSTGSPVAQPAPAPGPEPMPARAAPGWVSLDATPWAQVWIDGREADRTPIARYPLPSGPHRIVFKNPTTGREATREVIVESGKGASVVVNLETPP